MEKNRRQTSDEVASEAAKILRNSNASETAKRLAASALSQSGNAKQTGSDVEALASKVLLSKKYSQETKSVAGSVLSQSNKKR